MNTELRKIFKFFLTKLMNNSVFRKTMKYVQKHREIKVVTSKKRRNYLISEPNYHSAKIFTGHFLDIRMKKNQILMNETAYLRLLILKMSKPVMCEFSYDYEKAKYCEKAKMCYMDIDSFIVYIKTNDIYKDIAEGLETRFDTSNYELKRSLPKGKDKKIFNVMKDELGGNIMK